MGIDDGDNKDAEIEQVRTQEQRLTAAAKREAAERKRADKLFAKKALQAKKAKDARAFGQLLRLRNVPENSQEWKKAWKFFYS